MRERVWFFSAIVGNFTLRGPSKMTKTGSSKYNIVIK